VITVSTGTILDETIIFTIITTDQSPLYTFSFLQSKFRWLCINSNTVYRLLTRYLMSNVSSVFFNGHIPLFELKYVSSTTYWMMSSMSFLKDCYLRSVYVTVKYDIDRYSIISPIDLHSLYFSCYFVNEQIKTSR
jgi:hypothetical protein